MKLRKLGNSHYLLLPYDFVKLFGWDENTLINFDVDCEENSVTFYEVEVYD